MIILHSNHRRNPSHERRYKVRWREHQIQGPSLFDGLRKHNKHKNRTQKPHTNNLHTKESLHNFRNDSFHAPQDVVPSSGTISIALLSTRPCGAIRVSTGVLSDIVTRSSLVTSRPRRSWQFALRIYILRGLPRISPTGFSTKCNECHFPAAVPRIAEWPRRQS